MLPLAAFRKPMETPKAFEAEIRRKVPYLTNLFLWLFGVCFLVIIVFELIFSPFKRAGPEIQSAVFSWLVPEFWKKVYIFSLLGFCSTVVLYRLLRSYRSAVIHLNFDNIIIKGRAINLTFPIKAIRKIYVNDARTMNGESKERLSITIEQKRKGKATAFRLKSYSKADEFMEQLMKYESIDFKFYDFFFNPTHTEEE